MPAEYEPGPPPPRPLRIAVLGTAHPHLTDHLRALAGRAEVVSVLPGRYPGPDPGRHPGGPALPSALAGVPPAADPAAAVARADAALVCSTTAEHAELLAAAAAAGLPVLVEKPLAANATETAALARAAAATGPGPTVAMFLRCAPVLRRARELLRDRRLGRLVAADAWFTHPGFLDGLFADMAWMLEPSWGGGSAFADLGIHLVDLLRWLRPTARIRVRAASLRPLPGRRPGDIGGTALVEWGSVPAALHAGWASRPGGVRLRLEGTCGTLQVQGDELTFAGSTGVLTERHPAPAAGDAMTAFLASLAGETVWQPPSTADVVGCARVLDSVARHAA